MNQNEVYNLLEGKMSSRQFCIQQFSGDCININKLVG